MLVAYTHKSKPWSGARARESHGKTAAHVTLQQHGTAAPGAGAAAELEMGEEEFVAAFRELLRQQDKGVPAGTLAFMAPEQFLAETDAEPYAPQATTPRCDVYALGVTMFRLLSGKFPMAVPEKHHGRQMTFRQSLDAWTSLHRRQLTQSLPRVSEVVPADFRTSAVLWDAVDQAIARAVEKDPSRRHDSAAALARQLAADLRQEVGAADPHLGEGLYIELRGGKLEAAGGV